VFNDFIAARAVVIRFATKGAAPHVYLQGMLRLLTRAASISKSVTTVNTTQKINENLIAASINHSGIVIVIVVPPGTI
jgi:hypothetical protein